ncbi:hypothetical protein AGLY_014174 [Aphis glycines]|uniref:Uncharacterized protein n=1 Tax=Aphis glycines TaxID=307491 RepID=A0A6G0T4C0_APHGL|nr:hypothetical protein AGLY_014174 [Aphis glycines]
MLPKTNQWLNLKRNNKRTSVTESTMLFHIDVYYNIAKAKRIGNCSLLKGMVESDGIIGIRGSRTTFPLNFPDKMVASRMFPTSDRLVTTVVSGNSILPFPISNSCSENICADGSFCNCTRIFMVNRSVSTLRHKNDCFKHALISSAKVERGITGKVCRKSPDKILFNASSEYLCAIVHSSQIIIELFRNTAAIPLFFLMLHIASGLL